MKKMLPFTMTKFGTEYIKGVDVSERLNIVFAALGAIKGMLNRGIKVMDERKSYFEDVADRPNFPFGANYVILPMNEYTSKEAERLINELDDRLKALSDNNPNDSKEKIAILYSAFPFE